MNKSVLRTRLKKTFNSFKKKFFSIKSKYVEWLLAKNCFYIVIHFFISNHFKLKLFIWRFIINQQQLYGDPSAGQGYVTRQPIK